MVLNTLLLLWYVPYLIDHLGLAAYGMIPLANSLVLYATVLTASLDVSINRFMAIDLNRGDVSAANRTFNTAIALAVSASALITVPAGVVVWLFPSLFNVPPGLDAATRLLFGSVTATLCAAMLSSSFGVASVAKHRFELRNLVRALTSLSRVGIVVLCFSLYSPELGFVAIGFLGSALIGMAGDVLVSRHLAPELRLAPRLITRPQMRAMLELSGWSAINQVGALLLMQIDLLVVNALYGPEATGRYGSIIVLIALIHSITEAITAVVSPVIMAHYAASETGALRRVTLRSVRLLGLFLALPVGLLCAFGRPLLRLWLGREFGDLDLILIILASHLPITLAVRPILYCLTAYERVRVPSMVTLALGITTIPVAILFARGFGWGPAGVAAATSLIWLLRNLVFVIPYGAAVLGIRASQVYSIVTATAASTAGVAAAGLCIAHLSQPQSWSSIALAAVAVSAAYAMIVYAGLLTGEDQTWLRTTVLRRRPA